MTARTKHPHGLRPGPRRTPPSLRGAERRSNPDDAVPALDCFALRARNDGLVRQSSLRGVDAPRHCEERSDEAIQTKQSPQWIASPFGLAMTDYATCPPSLRGAKHRSNPDRSSHRAGLLRPAMTALSLAIGRKHHRQWSFGAKRTVSHPPSLLRKHSPAATAPHLHPMGAHRNSEARF
jgi:hypothetical protein